MKSRTFSIAITAWSANVLRSSISLSVKGDLEPEAPDYADRLPSRDQRDAERCPEPACKCKMLPSGTPPTRRQIGDMDVLAIQDCSAGSSRVPRVVNSPIGPEPDRALMCNRTAHVSVHRRKSRRSQLAQARRTLRHRVEHRLTSVGDC